MKVMRANQLCRKSFKKSIKINIHLRARVKRFPNMAVTKFDQDLFLRGPLHKIRHETHAGT